MVSVEGTSSPTIEQQARPVEKRKRQSEDTRDDDWLQDVSMKSKKRVSQIQRPRTAGANNPPTVQVPPTNLKIGPPRGAKRKGQPKQAATDTSSCACIQKPPQLEATPTAASFAVPSSCDKPSPMCPIRLRQEEEESSEDDATRSHEAPSISTVIDPDRIERRKDTSGGSHSSPHAPKDWEIPLTSKSTPMDMMERARSDLDVSRTELLPALVLTRSREAPSISTVIDPDRIERGKDTSGGSPSPRAPKNREILLTSKSAPMDMMERAKNDLNVSRMSSPPTLEKVVLTRSQEAPSISIVIDPDIIERGKDTSGGSPSPRAPKSREILLTSKSTPMDMMERAKNDLDASRTSSPPTLTKVVVVSDHPNQIMTWLHPGPSLFIVSITLPED